MRNNWQLNASATWMRAKGTLQEGRGGAGEQGSGVGIEQRGGLQFRNFGRNPNKFVNVDGRLRSDVEWQLKAQLVYQLPAGFLVSANFSTAAARWLIRRIRGGPRHRHPWTTQRPDPAATRRERTHPERDVVRCPDQKDFKLGEEGQTRGVCRLLQHVQRERDPVRPKHASWTRACSGIRRIRSTRAG